MGALTEWVRPLLAAALLLGTVEALIPDGPVRLTGKFAVGLALFCVIAGPLMEIIPDEIPAQLEQQSLSAEAIAQLTDENQESYLAQVMSERTAEYIETKAGQMGMRVTAVVCCESRNGLPVPVSATLGGVWDEAHRGELTGLIGEELQIAEDQIFFEEVKP